MATKPSIEQIKQNAHLTRQTIAKLKNELAQLTEEYNAMMIKELREENAKLSVAVEDAKRRLINAEVKSGVKQIPIPNSNGSVKVTEPEPEVEVEVKKEPKVKKEKKAKEPKEPTQELPIDVGRLDLRIGKVEEVKRHPDADTLYVLQINCGEAKPRTVCSGLVNNVAIDELKDRKVVLLCNLKPVKMRGITSEAMVMCACKDGEFKTVEVLLPPANSEPGDLVHVEGYTRQPDAIMNPKKKIFETVAPDLHTNDKLQACYKGSAFEVPGKGFCLAKSLKNAAVR